jgi:hypothetical protein
MNVYISIRHLAHTKHVLGPVFNSQNQKKVIFILCEIYLHLKKKLPTETLSAPLSVLRQKGTGERCETSSST